MQNRMQEHARQSGFIFFIRLKHNNRIIKKMHPVCGKKSCTRTGYKFQPAESRCKKAQVHQDFISGELQGTAG